MKSTSMSPGCYVGVAGVGPRGRRRPPDPRPKFSAASGGHPQPVGVKLNQYWDVLSPHVFNALQRDILEPHKISNYLFP